MFIEVLKVVVDRRAENDHCTCPYPHIYGLKITSLQTSPTQISQTCPLDTSIHHNPVFLLVSAGTLKDRRCWIPPGFGITGTRELPDLGVEN